MKNGKHSRKPKGSSGQEISLIFPGAEGWELWRGPAWDHLALVQAADRPSALPESAPSVLCFPSPAFSSLPHWNAVMNGVSDREQSALNLEGHGLLGVDPASAVWAIDPIREEAKEGEGGKEIRELTAAAVLQPQLSPDWILEDVQRHEIPARLLVAPGSGTIAVLRRELGKWILDLYADGHWLHSQILMAGAVGEELAREISLLLLQLKQEGICGHCREMVTRQVLEGRELGVMEKVSGLRVVFKPEAPRFLLPKPAWDLLPGEVALRRKNREQRKKIKGILTWAVVADLVLWGVAGLFLLIPAIRVWHLEIALTPLRPEYRRIHGTQITWGQLRSLTDPAGSALEVLNQVAAPLMGSPPPVALKLVNFSFTPKELILSGITQEGEQVILDYLRGLAQNPKLAGLYDWPEKPQVEGQDQQSTFTIVAPSTAPPVEVEERDEK